MTRLISILGAIFCFGLIVPMVATEQSRGEFDLTLGIVHVAIQFISTFFILFYCGFATLHSVSHVGDPHERMGWILMTVGLNVLGSLIYYLTKYQDFRTHGLGRLTRPKNKHSHSFFKASQIELQQAEQGAAAKAEQGA